VDQAFAQPAKDEDTGHMAWLSPIISGLIMSLFSYGIARKFKVEKSKALGAAMTMGGVTALGYALSNWLHDKAAPIKAAEPAIATATPVAPTEKLLMATPAKS
jgi:hypothetical protein